MKSFTRNQTNLRALGADRRLDVLAKKQETEHQHALSGHRREMQELRDALTLSMQKFEAVSQRTEAVLSDFKEQATHAITLLKERTVAQDRVIAEQKKSIDALQDQLLNFQVLYSSLRDVDNVKKEMKAQLLESTKNHLCSLQDLQREFKSEIGSLKEELGKFKEETDKRLCEQSDRIEARYNVNKIDRDSVLQEIRVRQRELFVIEKKIENIYTLIERINKRGESCHKQG